MREYCKNEKENCDNGKKLTALSGNDDLCVLKRMKRGDETALKVFFDKYMDAMHYQALGMVHDQLVAEDVVQEVFIRFWDNRSRLDISISVFAYLRQSIANACLNYLDHVVVENRFAQAYKDSFREEEEEYDLAELEELRLRLYAFLDTLPDKCREIFLLACVEGLKYREVAERLDVSVNTVKTQIKIAYRQLRSAFGDRDLKFFLLLLLLHSEF